MLSTNCWYLMSCLFHGKSVSSPPSPLPFHLPILYYWLYDVSFLSWSISQISMTSDPPIYLSALVVNCLKMSQENLIIGALSSFDTVWTPTVYVLPKLQCYTEFSCLNRGCLDCLTAEGNGSFCCIASLYLGLSRIVQYLR